MASSRALDKTAAFFKLIVAIVVMGVVGAGFLIPYVAGAGLATRAATDKFLDATCDLQETALAQTSTVYANDGKTVIATLFSDNRRPVALTAVPKLMQQALIDTEDRRFYDHHGIDTRGLLRAALNESSGSTQGASTLTQQYVKQVRFYQAKTPEEQQAAIEQTGDRKLTEAKCALQLEKKYTKLQILEKYFNIAFFGEQSYGIYVAAQNYFATTPQKLTVPQAAVLAGLVKNPSLYDPFLNPKEAKDRRDIVIENMAKAGDITEAQSAAYQKTPIKVADKATRPSQGCANANDTKIKNVGFFCDYALQWLTTTGGLTMQNLQTGGYKIITSIDPALQNQAQNAVFGAFPAAAPTTLVQPSVNPANGQVTTMVTSKLYDYGQAHNTDARYTSVPVFTQASAGSGSTYKYFAMIAALTAGFGPEQNITTPFKAGPQGATYYPTNCGDPRGGMSNAGNYASTYSLRHAAQASSNTFFVGLEDQLFKCDLTPIVNTAVALGMNTLNQKDPQSAAGLSFAQSTIADQAFSFTLGQLPTSALELSSAYSASANDGVLCSPKPVLGITVAATGKAVSFKQAGCKRVMSQWVARTAVDILTGDTHGSYCTACEFFGNWYNQGGSQVASKTGTNNDVSNKGNSALWFVGMTPSLTAASALVNLTNASAAITLPGVGDSQAFYNTFGSYASQFWLDAYGSTLLANPWTWPQPDNIAPDQINVPVSSYVNQSEGDVVDALKALGLNPQPYPVQCGSSAFIGNVAYVGPAVATPGQTVYYCISNGQPLTSPPIVRQTPTKGTTPKPTTGATPTR